MSNQLSLRAAADSAGVGVGAAVSFEALQTSEVYRETLAREFNLMVAENCMKFGALRPAPDQFNFDEADQLVKFAEENDMRMRGHTLVWHTAQPDWLINDMATASSDKVRTVLEHHIQTVVKRYRGRITSWDVVNEAIDDQAQMRSTFWFDKLGPDYLEFAFRTAHSADPAVQLVYNDYSIEVINPKSDRVYSMLQDMLERGVPVHAVGLQMHVPLEPGWSMTDLAANIQRFRALGLDVLVTEMDVRVPTPVTPEKLELQARTYGDIFKTCLENGCRQMLCWGFTDACSWVPGFFKDCDQAMPFDAQCLPKPASAAIRDVLQKFSGQL